MFNFSVFSLVIVLTTSQLVSGCATTRVAGQNQISIESVDSSLMRINRSYLKKTPEGLSLQGEIRAKFNRRMYTAGHIHVEIINGNGSIVKRAELKPDRNPVNRKIARFSILLPQDTTAGTVVRLIHHDASPHWKEGDLGVWKDVSVRNQFYSRSGYHYPMS